jgi:hypothetical protein
MIQAGSQIQTVDMGWLKGTNEGKWYFVNISSERNIFHEQVFLPAIKGLVPPMMVEAICDLLDFSYLVHQNSLDEKTLDMANDALALLVYGLQAFLFSANTLLSTTSSISKILGHQMDYVHQSLNVITSQLWSSLGVNQVGMKHLAKCFLPTSSSINWLHPGLTLLTVEYSLLTSHHHIRMRVRQKMKKVVLLRGSE